MDPQRQHAQLRLLWAQGNKSIRRIRHLDKPLGYQDLEKWWNLTRQLNERQIDVLPFPVDEQTALISWDEGKWATVRGVSVAKPYDEAFRNLVYVDFSTDAWALNGYQYPWVVSAALTRSMGRGLWSALSSLFLEPLQFGWQSPRDTLDILAALYRHPHVFAVDRVKDWLMLARLWRHRGTWQRISIEGKIFSQRYPWIEYNGLTSRAFWPADEDIVH